MKTKRLEQRSITAKEISAILMTLALTVSCSSNDAFQPKSDKSSDNELSSEQPQEPVSTPRPIEATPTPASTPVHVSTPTPTPTTTPAPVPTPITTPKPTPVPTPVEKYTVEAAPLWEAKNASYRAWTLHAFSVVDTYGSALMLGSSDVTSYCPAYFSLSTNQKMNFWVYLVSAVTKYESAFNPLSRYKETTMGTDPITGQPVYSEGLLQLSYQDVQAYPFCNEFDWSVDSKLSATDPRKTILDPYKNLSCGIKILNRQVDRKDLIGMTSGVYWAVLKVGGAYTKVPEIQSLTNQIPFCKR